MSGELTRTKILCWAEASAAPGTPGPSWAEAGTTTPPEVIGREECPEHTLQHTIAKDAKGRVTEKYRTKQIGIARH